MQLINASPTIITSQGIESFFVEQGLVYTDELSIPLGLEESLNHFASELQQEAHKCKLVKKMSLAFPFLKEQGLLPKIDISYISPEIGFGAFAAEPIKQLDMIEVYSGELIWRESTNNSKYLIPYGSSKLYWVNKNSESRLLVDANECGNRSRYINHVNKKHKFVFPDNQTKVGRNAGWVSCFYEGRYHSVVVATRDIQKGEELRIDYGSKYFLDGNHPPSTLFFLQNNQLFQLPRKK